MLELEDDREDLQKALSLLEATIDSVNDGILTIYSDQKSPIFNKRLMEMWEIEAEKMRFFKTFKWLRLVFRKIQNPRLFIKKVKTIVQDSDSHFLDLIELKNGRAFESRAQPLQIGGEIVGRTWSFRDVTDRVLMEQNLRQQTEKDQLAIMIAQRIRESLKLGEILQTTVGEVREFLQTDRVLIYQFQSDWSGTVVVESVADAALALLGMNIKDDCFVESYIKPYREGKVHAIANTEQSNLSPCYLQFLSQLQVRSNLALPILQSDKLWGLLLAHHCQNTRDWHFSEIKLLQFLANQVSIAIQQATLFEKLERANRELYLLASIDGLTQIPNRRRFEQYLDKMWLKMQETRQPLALILGDVDRFKIYNDTYGHLAGDECLQQVAQVLTKSVRHSLDLVARYGGEEFAVILPQAEASEALEVAETIRNNLKAEKIIHAQGAGSQYVTMSLGICSLIPDSALEVADLITRADIALFKAKGAGRDRALLG